MFYARTTRTHQTKTIPQREVGRAQKGHLNQPRNVHFVRNTGTANPRERYAVGAVVVIVGETPHQGERESRSQGEARQARPNETDWRHAKGALANTKSVGLLESRMTSKGSRPVWWAGVGKAVCYTRSSLAFDPTSTGEGGEVRPKRPTGGKAKPGITRD